MTAKAKIVGQAIVIPGEASETDEELEFEIDQRAVGLTNFAKYPNWSPHQRNPPNQKPKHDGLLHCKLRDAQINLAIDAADLTGKMTQQMTTNAQRVAQGVLASQLTLQDATCHIRTVADDLYKIDDSLDAVFNSHAMIPDLANFDSYPAIKQYAKISK